MAPQKRSYQGPHGESIEILESASSHLRSTSNKRQRVSSVDSVDTSSESVERELPILSATQRQETFREEYERVRDGVSVVPESTDLAKVEKQAEQIKLETEQLLRGIVNAGNQEAENGVLESIKCINFMCHECLEVKLGPLINFIIGHNGSGKSAVLSAITLCLGGKATDTNRGGSLKKFIKNGKDYATLIVNIKNKGESAYKRDLYGDSIIVERHFSTNGTSGFKLKSEKGRVISTKRAELDDISDFYALQLNNPCNVLTQDMARQFLNSASPADKYKFFIKGVQLEQLDQDYKVVADHLDGIDAQMEHQRDALNELGRLKKEARDKLRLSEKQSGLREKLLGIRRQMAWAQVEDQEKILSDAEHALTDVHLKIEKKKEVAATLEAAFDEKVRLLEEAHRELRDAQESQAPLTEQNNEANVAIDSQSKEMYDCQSEQREIKQKRDVHKRSADKFQNDLDEEYARLEAANGGSEASKLAEIKSAEAAVEDLKSQRDEHQGTFEQLLADKNEAERLEKNAEPGIERSRREMEKFRRDVQNIESRGSEQMSSFPPNTQNLLKAIQQDSRYRRKPVGPIGLHVRLIDSQWSSIIEKTFGGSLSSYVVTSKHDQNILSETMRKNRCVSNIFVAREEPLNISQHEPDSSVKTMLRVLEINNDLVRNSLVIQHGIEQTALYQTNQEAKSVMFQDPPPRNIRACISHHPTARGFGSRYSLGRGNAHKMDNIQAWEGKPRMKTDLEAQKASARQRLDTAKFEFNEASNQLRELQEKSKKAEQAIKRHKQQTAMLKEDCQRAEYDLERLRQELEDAAPQDGKIEATKQELEAVQNEVKFYDNQLELSRDAMLEHAEKAASLKARQEETQQNLKAAEDSIRSIESDVSKLIERRSVALRKKNEGFEEVNDAEKEREYVEGCVHDARETVDEFITQAQRISARVNVSGNYDTLTTKQSMLEQEIKRAEQEVGGDRESIARACTEATLAHQHAHEDFYRLEQLSNALTNSLVTRRERWRYFRSQISVRARSQFMYLLTERGFHGGMAIDHITKQLELDVHPASSAAQSLFSNRSISNQPRGRSTKALSGGEKSFSTICMLLALWDAIGSPIRCLDEFDVFMDSVNRDISMKLMLQAARRSVSRQYILITPQAMGNVELGTDVKVIRLSDPERGQKVLPFVPVEA